MLSVHLYLCLYLYLYLCLYLYLEVPVETCHLLLSQVHAHVTHLTPAGKPIGSGPSFTDLTETNALGAGGTYCNKHWPAPVLIDIQRAIVQALQLLVGAAAEKGVLPAANTKAVLLAYTTHGKNWAHQDDNRLSPYQAVLMLSDPGVDFTGGELYVLDGERDYAKHRVTWTGRGDVAVFKSNGSWFHGMDQVRSGTGKVTERLVVGLLHPQ